MIDVNNLMFEVTRRCNIKCEHCLRGSSMRMDLSKEYVDILLDQISSICDLSFTGGEPSLNVPMLNYILDGIKRRGISVGSFYIATNGVKISEDFVVFLLRMYSYCDEKEMCQVNYSNDYFHMREGKPDLDLLNGLSFFSKKFNDGFTYNGGRALIKQGRSKEGHSPNFVEVETLDDLNETELYLNCEGKIVNGCDWSYSNQKKHVLCDVSELTKFVESLPE